MDDASRKGVAGGYCSSNAAAQDVAPAAQRPTYLIVLKPAEGIDGVRALRRGLKYLLRTCGLRCLDAREIER
jgi:hypothetical protein